MGQGVSPHDPLTMARKPREQSIYGIYHVMLRGINKQDIFLEDGDYRYMMRILSEMPFRLAPGGTVISHGVCTVYAYCILPNHIHLLIREGDSDISSIMQKIEDRFVAFYNRKYDRTGHLFQARFRSEPVNDRAYFFQLIRYIHRNPVKAWLCDSPEAYPYSSWREYVRTCCPDIRVCNVRSVYNSIEYEELMEFVNLDVEDDCLDMNSERFSYTDAEAWEILSEISNMPNVESFKQLAPVYQIEYIAKAHGRGVSLRQAARLSSLSYSKIQRDLGKSGSKCQTP